jgi:hypothetical protein
MSEYDMELGEVVRKCHICNLSFALQDDLLKHQEVASRRPAQSSRDRSRPKVLAAIT